MRWQKDAIVFAMFRSRHYEPWSSYYLNCRKEFCGERFNMVIHYHYYNCLHREQTPWFLCSSLQSSSDTAHKGQAVNQRTHDPDPVLAERELSLQGEGFGSRLWPSETSRAGMAPHTPVCRKLYPLGQKKSDVCGNLRHMRYRESCFLSELGSM